MIFKILLFIGAIVLLIIFPLLACALFHPYSDTKYAILDTFNYFRHKRYNECKGTGRLVMYTGLFGKGKTLSCVHQVRSLYLKYNNKMVWSNYHKCFVPQRVVIMSNVDLDIPYVKLESIGQFVSFVRESYDLDIENKTSTVTLCLMDEVSVQLNSRSFKTNIDPLFLNTLLTCRKFKCGLYMTAQRFNQVDALLRQVTQDAIECKKIWRFQMLYVYDAYSLEYATSPTLVKPRAKKCWFIKNSDFNSYNTLAMVDNLKKSVEEGDMLSQAEILNLQNYNPDNDNVTRPSRKAKRLRKTS